MPCREWRVSRNDLDFLGRISINAVKLPLELPWEVPAFPKRSLLCSQTVPRPGVDDVPAEDQMIFNDLFAQTLLQQSCTSGRMVGWMYLYWTDCNCIFYIAAHTHTRTGIGSRHESKGALWAPVWFGFLGGCVQSCDQPSFQAAPRNSPALGVGRMKREEGAFNLEFYYPVVALSSGSCWLHYSSKSASESPA